MTPPLIRVGDAFERESLKFLNSNELAEVWQVAATLDVQLLAQSVNDVTQSIEPRLPLGRYAESLCHYWLSKSDLWTVVLNNCQINQLDANGKRQVLGEIDFLVKSRESIARTQGVNHCQHWEFSINYFLALDGIFDDALGPNLKDTLSAKTKRVFSRQIHLSKTSAFEAMLQERGVPNPSTIESRALFQGWAFYPLESFIDSIESNRTAGACAAHEQLSNLASHGFWCSPQPNDLKALQELATIQGVTKWLCAPKIYWLAPRKITDFPTTLLIALGADSPSQALALRAANAQWFGHDAPLLLGFNQHGQELLRGFVSDTPKSI